MALPLFNSVTPAIQPRPQFDVLAIISLLHLVEKGPIAYHSWGARGSCAHERDRRGLLRHRWEARRAV